MESINRPLCSHSFFQLIWQYGDRHYHAKRWSEAADWFMTGSHQIFRSASASSSNSESKCFRKAALCYIEQHEYATASTVIRRCPTDEAATHYVILLTAAHQGSLVRHYSHMGGMLMVNCLLTGLEDEGWCLRLRFQIR